MLEQHSFFYYITLWKGYTRAVNILLRRCVTVFAVDWSDCMLRIMLTNRHFSTIALAFLFVLMANYLAVSSNPSILLCSISFSHHVFLCTCSVWWAAQGRETCRKHTTCSDPVLVPLSAMMVYRWEKRWYLLRIITVVQLEKFYY